MRVPGRPCYSPDPALKEFPGAEHLVNTLPVIPAPRYFMRCAWMPDIFYWPAHCFEAAVQHLALNDAGAAIILTMKNNEGGPDIFYVIDRRLPF